MSEPEFDLAHLLAVGENAIAYALHRLEQSDPARHAATLAGLADGTTIARLVIEAGHPCAARLWPRT